MFQNYIKTAIRTMLRFKGFAIINLLGLSLGLTAGILIMLFVIDELSFDKFHQNGHRTYRVLTQLFNPKSGAAGGSNDANGWPVGDVLRREFPEVESVVYMKGASQLMVNHDDKRFRQRIQFASPEFFSIFSFPLVEGNAQTALNRPWSVVISEDMAAKFFPGGDALNKTMVFSDTLQFAVSGVMKNMPANSHIQLDMIMSFASYETIFPDFSYEEGWGNINMKNYVMLKEGTDGAAFASKASNIYNDKVSEMLKTWGVNANVITEPLFDTYLKSTAGNSVGPLGSIDRVYLVAGIGIFVIILACINFVNLATARSIYRAREVGLRKVSGSSRIGLIRQFLVESLVITLLSFLAAIVLTWSFLPYFNDLMQKHYSLISFADPVVIGGIVTLLLLISCLAGFYPALVLSSMNPVEVLKGKMHTSSKGVHLRRSLVVFQFLISAGMVSGTLIVLDQLDFMQKQKLGFDKENILVVNAGRAKPVNENGHEVFKNQVRELAIVGDVSYNNALPGIPGWDGQFAYPEGRSGDNAVSVHYMAVDADYVPTMGLEIIHGRNFDARRETDMKDGLLINETSAGLMGWSPEEAVGKKITSPSGFPEGEVIGVLRDYHYAGLQQKIGPVVMDINSRNSYMYAIRYKASDTKQLISSLEQLWSSNFSGYEFNYFFLDDTFGEQYKSEQKLADVFTLFSMVTVVIAAVGLLGLVSFMVVSRTKEIGVRKVLGASIVSLAMLLTKEFLILVVVANLIAVPLTWYFAGEWLTGFAFRTSLNPILFMITTLAAVSLTIITVGYQTFRAALADPVRSLRHE
jgi:putative ABC transport system permease protein